MRSTPVMVAVGLAALAACAPARVATPSASNGRPEDRIPREIGAYRQTERDALPAGAGTSFRFRDTSAVFLTVILYGPDASEAARHREPVALVRHEGAKFAQVMDVQVRQGAFRNFRLLVSRPDSLQLSSRVIPGHLTAAAGVRRGRPVVELQHLYLIDSTFIKVRATVPEPSWPRTDIPDVVRTIVSAVGSG